MILISRERADFKSNPRSWSLPTKNTRGKSEFRNSDLASVANYTNKVLCLRLDWWTVVSVGGKRRRERKRERKRVSCTRCEGRRGSENRATGGGVKPRGLINETYAAAADTKMHCKYGVPEKLLSSDEIYACPSYTRVRMSNFFSFVETIRWVLFFLWSMPVQWLGPRADPSLLLHLHRTTNTRANRKAHPRALMNLFVSPPLLTMRCCILLLSGEN